MLTNANRWAVGWILMIGLFLTSVPPAYAQLDPATLAKAVESIEQLDRMRSQLGSTLETRGEPPTQETMKEVCRPVGMQAKHLAQENGWQVRQIATKYRNPNHAPTTLHETMALAKFKQEPELLGFWQREWLNDQTGTRYYRRINVETSCLACHGDKGDRPQFIQDKYPDDHAYDFKVGDLRGMYAVFMPDVQQNLDNTLSLSTLPTTLPPTVLGDHSQLGN